MYKTMHEKANATRSTQPPQSINTTPAEPTTRASTPANATQSTNAPAAPSTPTKPTKPKLDKTLFDLLTDVTAELIVESAKLDRLGRYLTKDRNSKN